MLTPQRDIFIPPVTQSDPHPEMATIDIREVPGGHWAPTFNPGVVGGLVASWIARHRQDPGSGT
ncbi:hypothetical protein ACFVJS_08840 [Nocardioides sp. NPDC057772]|uniref:hypothetical protein n=1 Tax=Nocardioides sp. NPDC057772 TaxID=3346245 RepID=UPI0036717CB7